MRTNFRIFALHRSEGTLDVYKNFEHISTCLLYIEGKQLVEYRKIISGALEEYIEAVAFGWFLSRAELISFSQLIQLTRMVLQDSATAAKFLMGEGLVGEGLVVEGPVGEGPMGEGLVGEVCLNEKYADFVYVGDYVMALFDTMGELMRYAIVHMESAASIVAVMKWFERKVLKEFSESGYSLDDLMMGISEGTFTEESRTVDNKLKTLRSSIEKVENSICDGVIRGVEGF